MVHLKTVLDTRRKKADGTYSIIFRITDFKKTYTLTSGIAVFEYEWDNSKREVYKSHPNALSINTTLSKKYYLIQSNILKLDNAKQFDYEELKNLINNKPVIFANTSFKEFSEKLIADMMEVKRTGNAVVYQTAVNQFLGYCSYNKLGLLK